MTRIPDDVRALVIAARVVAFGDQPPTREAIKALDKASEAFASRVPWDDEPEVLATREEAPACKNCGGKGYVEYEGGEGEGYPSRPEAEACGCRQEAPAEAGEEDGAWIIYFEDRDRELESFSGFGAREAAQRRYEQVTVSWNAHLFERVKSALPARAQPQAREDAQPVAWRMVGRDGSTISLQAEPYHGGFAHMMEADVGCTVQPLYTHPAPDALRVAVEALEPFAILGEWISDVWADDSIALERAAGRLTAGDFRRAVKALAALQAEQKGGA